MIRSSPSARRRRFLGAALALCAAALLAAYLFAPGIIQSQLQQRLGAALGRTVTVGKVQFNPLALSVTLENFDLRETDGRSSFVRWDRLYVNAEAFASLAGAWVVDEIMLEGLRASVQIRPDGSFNFSDLLARLEAKPPATAGPPAAPAPPAAAPGRPVHVRRLEVSQARVAFSDQSRARPFAAVIGPITFSTTDLHTSGARAASYHFAADTAAGEKLTWSGTLHAVPFRSSGEFRVEHLPLARYAPYHDQHLQADLADGKLSLRGRYEIDLSPAARRIKILDGALQLRSLKVLERASQEPLFELPSLDCTGIQADAMAREAAVGRVALHGGYLRARREKDGAFNLVSIVQPPKAPATAPAAPATTPPPAPAPVTPTPATPTPKVSVDELALREFAVDVVDLAAPRQVWLGLTGLECSLRQISLAPGTTMPLQFACKWAPQGTVRVTGQVSFQPEIKASLQTEIVGCEILPLSPYFEQFVNARLTQGAFSTTHKVDVALTGGTPAVTLAGDLRLEKVGVVDSARNEELAGVASLACNGLKVTTAPSLGVSIAEVNLTGPYARAAIGADGSLNLARLAHTAAAKEAPRAASAAPPPPSPAPAGTPGQAGTPAPRIEVGKVTIAGGDFSFTDRSLQPAARTTLGQLGGAIAGLSSANMARADVSLVGAMDGAGSVTVTGRLDPFGATPFVDLKVDCRNVDLFAFSPYSGKYAGFELARGKLAVDTRVKLEGQKLDATNVVNIDRLTFGAPVPSPDATKLPVRLGVALLKDLNGRIVIDLPIQGKLDDPEFKIGRVVGRVLTNLLTKAAVSPFTLLGSMFGGGGEELAYQEFAPGSSALQAGEAPKLATLLKALVNRPELQLALEGCYDTAADTHALKRIKLSDTIRRSLWEQKRAAEPNLPPPDQLVITPAEEAAMLQSMFDRAFPPGTEFGTPLPAPPAVVQPPEPPAGFFPRIVRALTGAERREQQAAQTENERRAAEHRQAMKQALATGRPLDEMLGRLAETMPVDAGDLAALAATRAQRVRDHLITKGQIAADRLFLAKATDPKRAAQGPRVFLSLQ